MKGIEYCLLPPKLRITNSEVNQSQSSNLISEYFNGDNFEDIFLLNSRTGFEISQTLKNKLTSSPT